MMGDGGMRGLDDMEVHGSVQLTISKGKRRKYERGSIIHKDKHSYLLSPLHKATGLQKPP